MSEWAKVVTHPLGLAGFALFVLFLFLRGKGHRSTSPGKDRIFIVVGICALFGGLGLAYLQTKDSKPASPPPSTEQITHGPNSPAVSGVKGDVTITIQEDPHPEKRKQSGDNK